MNQENRVAAIVAAHPAERAESLRLLLDKAPLAPNEIDDVCHALAGEANPAMQTLYWRLLERSVPSSRPLDLALSCIMNPAALNRGEAVRYLRFCFPDRLPALLEAFARDPDEELRYQLSEFLKDSDVEAAVGMKIGMLADASTEKQEILIAEIAELGNLWHLEALRGLDQLSGGNSAFDRAAQLLAARTKA